MLVFRAGAFVCCGVEKCKELKADVISSTGVWGLN